MFCYHLDEEERVGFFLMSSDWLCSVALPYCAVVWSAASDCGNITNKKINF